MKDKTAEDHYPEQPEQPLPMETVTSFSARRPAANALPAFTLPPPTSEIPRASDGLSPSLSSVHTGSSQGSQAPNNLQYTYSSHVHGGWPAPGGSSYHVHSGAGAQQSLAQTPYGGRPSMYGQPNMPYGSQRNSQSPATGGEALSAPPYEHVHQHFQSSGGGHENHPSLQSGSMLAHHPTQPPASSSAPAHVNPYEHRPSGNAPNYAPSAPHHQSNYSYTTQPSPTTHSPTSNGPLSRGLGSFSSQGAPPPMAPPGSYRPYQSYQQLPTMNGAVMSNIHQPGGQLSMIPGMVPSGYGPPHTMMYTHTQPQPQSERPFKCDQCVQSFSRNHDLKRHKRIHLAVKPFPCTFCSKSFSRKDALKRHRLVKGCETKGSDTNDVNHNRNGEAEDDGPGMRKTP